MKMKCPASSDAISMFPILIHDPVRRFKTPSAYAASATGSCVSKDYFCGAENIFHKKAVEHLQLFRSGLR